MYKIALLILIIIFSQNFSLAQEDKFPQDWLGVWKGTMTLDYSSGKYQEIACEVHIKTTDSTNVWKWIIVYGEGDKRQERKYELIAKDLEKGIYVIDEKNSIILDAFYANNTLISQFEVQNNLITSTYQKSGDIIYFQNLASKTKEPNKTGGKNDIPEVISYPVTSIHRAKLERIK